MGGDRWIADSGFDDAQHEAVREFVTPRTDKDGRVVWPVDEIEGETP
jgi:hypothetical protein